MLSALRCGMLYRIMRFIVVLNICREDVRAANVVADDVNGVDCLVLDSK